MAIASNCQAGPRHLILDDALKIPPTAPSARIKWNIFACLFIVDAGVFLLDELLIEIFKRLDEKVVSQQCLAFAARSCRFLPCVRSCHSVYPSSFGGAL